MKPKSLASGVVAAGVVFAICWWVLTKERPQPIEDGVPPDLADATAPASQGEPTKPAPPPREERGPASTANAAMQAWHGFNLKRDGPVAFHAVVQDESGAGVSGVRATFELLSYNQKLLQQQMEAKDGQQLSNFLTQRFEALSDNAGRVAVTGRTGHRLILLELTHSDYLLPDRDDPMRSLPQWTFGFGAHAEQKGPGVTSLERPFPIPAWRKKGGAPLIRQSLRLPVGRPPPEQGANLFTGEMTATPDLVATRQPARSMDAARPHDWILRLESPDGGMLLSRETYLCSAPVEGYAEHLDFDITPERIRADGGTGWQKAYLKLRRGHIFGAIYFRLDNLGTAVEYSVAVNPTGSPSLEPDPAKQITDPEEIRRLDEETARGLKP